MMMIGWWSCLCSFELQLKLHLKITPLRVEQLCTRNNAAYAFSVFFIWLNSYPVNFLFSTAFKAHTYTSKENKIIIIIIPSISVHSSSNIPLTLMMSRSFRVTTNKRCISISLRFWIQTNLAVIKAKIEEKQNPNKLGFLSLFIFFKSGNNWPPLNSRDNLPHNIYKGSTLSVHTDSKVLLV